MSVRITPFGVTTEGKPVKKVVLKNHCIEVHAMTYGATITHIFVPDENNIFTDVVLGYDDVQSYEHNGNYFGALVGRNANRLGGSAVTIDGMEYKLTPNEGKNQLHGGPDGFSFRIFDVQQAGDNAVTFTLESPDGDQGYPGNLTAQMTLSIGDDRSFTIHWQATTDKATICNFTNHNYYNLNGHNVSGAMAQWVQIEADSFTPLGEGNIATGEIRPVENTPMDFTEGHQPARDLLLPYEPLVSARGFDHNYVLRKEGQGMALAATMVGTASGIEMKLYTDQPGLQMYTGNYITADIGKGGSAYGNYTGIALEPQALPDTPHHPQFGSTVLRPGETYDKRMTCVFDIVE